MSNSIEINDVYFGSDRCLPNGDAVYDIIATTAYGERFALVRTITNEQTARALTDKIAVKGVIDPQYWSELPPVYGSPASQDELFEASLYSMSLARGLISGVDVPEAYQVLI